MSQFDAFVSLIPERRLTQQKKYCIDIIEIKSIHRQVLNLYQDTCLLPTKLH